MGGDWFAMDCQSGLFNAFPCSGRTCAIPGHLGALFSVSSPKLTIIMGLDRQFWHTVSEREFLISEFITSILGLNLRRLA